MASAPAARQPPEQRVEAAAGGALEVFLGFEVDDRDTAHGAAGIDRYGRRERHDDHEAGGRVRLDHPSEMRGQALTAQRLVGDHQNDDTTDAYLPPASR